MVLSNLATEKRVFTQIWLEHRLDWQSAFTTHAVPCGHAEGQPPPQSGPVSVPFLIPSVQDGVATLLVNRAERRNALSSPMMAEMARLVAEIDRDDSVRVLVVTGAGKVFCSGLDLGAMGQTPGEPALERELVDRVLLPLDRLSKPTIAAMNGDALAGGLELGLHCDVRIAVPSASPLRPVLEMLSCVIEASVALLPSTLPEPGSPEVAVLQA